jgi:hypothetical protein
MDGLVDRKGYKIHLLNAIWGYGFGVGRLVY